MSQSLFTDVVQIGVVVKDADMAVAHYRELLNLHDWHVNYVDTKQGKGANFYKADQVIVAKAKIAWANMGTVEMELIEPLDDNSVYSDFLREKGQGIHHVMFATADYDRCREKMAEQGITELGGGELQETRFVMFDTEKTLGVIAEIAAGEPLIPDESL